MAEGHDFEQAWLGKLARCLEEVAGEDIRRQVMQGSEALSERSERSEVIAWTRGAMERLESLVDAQQSKDILAGCACQYPKSDLQAVRERYEATGDIGLAHRMLQARFVSFLRDTLGLSDALIEEVVARGWGVAGVMAGDTIVATKIPKSGNLVAYMNEPDPEKRRQFYCHCPRVRDALRTSEALPPVYCYCGAGFYKSIWEEILQQPVEVEVLESVLDGGEVCKIAVRLPSRR